MVEHQQARPAPTTSEHRPEPAWRRAPISGEDRVALTEIRADLTVALGVLTLPDWTGWSGRSAHAIALERLVAANDRLAALCDPARVLEGVL